MKSCPRLEQMVVVEEKYSFTPDCMKAATRHKRQNGDRKSSLGHLKVSTETVSTAAFDKKSILSTASGRQIISTYLAASVSSLDVRQDLVLIVDSELTAGGDRECNCDGACACVPKFSVPL